MIYHVTFKTGERDCQGSKIQTSWLHHLLILGLILYAIFNSPLFLIEILTCYADDKYSLVENSNRTVLAMKMTIKLERIVSWQM